MKPRREYVREHRKRRKAGMRLLEVWLSPDELTALQTYGLLEDVTTTDTDDLAEAARVLLRGLGRRAIALDLNWAVVDARTREDRSREARMLSALGERELLYTGHYSSLARPG